MWRRKKKSTCLDQARTNYKLTKCKPMELQKEPDDPAFPNDLIFNKHQLGQNLPFDHHNNQNQSSDHTRTSSMYFLILLL